MITSARFYLFINNRTYAKVNSFLIFTLAWLRDFFVYCRVLRVTIFKKEEHKVHNEAQRDTKNSLLTKEIVNEEEIIRTIPDEFIYIHKPVWPTHKEVAKFA